MTAMANVEIRKLETVARLPVAPGARARDVWMLRLLEERLCIRDTQKLVVRDLENLCEPRRQDGDVWKLIPASAGETK